ncbi:MAG: L-rhamnose mutarotase [Spongiibacteraceae bacterium]|nr:L-rhamnose mutarotase [Spongiibacteraceae bacterium]
MTPTPIAFGEQLAFVMYLKPGCKHEYKQRHTIIWPELVEALKKVGISDYSIYFEEHHQQLFAVLRCDDPDKLDKLALQPIMRRWWNFMADIMLCHEDKRPISTPLERVFYLA